jgi:hypothetical protein
MRSPIDLLHNNMDITDGAMEDVATEGIEAVVDVEAEEHMDEANPINNHT